MEPKQASPGSEAGTPHAVRACLSCARAKAKCVPGDESIAKCQRCHRLQRPCEPAAPRAQTQPRKRKAGHETDHLNKHRVEKLEQKLDGIVTLLTASKDPANPDIAPRLASSTPTLSYSSAETLQLPVLPSASDVAASENAENWDERLLRGGSIRQRFALIGGYNPALDPPAQTPPPKFSLDGVNFEVENPEILLHIFKSEMNLGFPFISIPDSITAEALRRDKPSLFTAVMAVTTRDSMQQVVLGKMLMRQVAERIMVNGERNMDLLLAVLTYAGWSYHHFYNISQLTSFVTSATTLVADLRLMRPVAKDARGFYEAAIHSSSNMTGGACASGIKPFKQAQRLMDERRAALGYWFLTSVVGSFFQRLETAKWTPYLDECCGVLNQAEDHRDDKLAVSLVRIQLLSEKISQNPWHGTSDAMGTAAPPVLYLKSLQDELKSLENDLHAQMQANTSILLTFRNVEVMLYKIGLSKSRALSSFSNRDFNRLEFLYACTEAVRAFFDAYLAIPANRYHTMSMHMHMHMTWNMGVLQMLSTFEHPDWNLAWMRELISLSNVLGKLAETLSTVKASLNFDPNTSAGIDMFSQSSKKMSWIKSFFEKGVTGEGLESHVSETLTGDMSDAPSGVEFMDFVDDAWIRDLLGPWEY